MFYGCENENASIEISTSKGLSQTFAFLFNFCMKKPPPVFLHTNCLSVKVFCKKLPYITISVKH